MSAPATRERPLAPPGFRGAVRTEPATLRAYDEVSGPYRLPARAVVVPADADDVAALLEWAPGAGVPLVPRGAGTGMPAGNVGPGVLVDLVPGLSWIEAPDRDRGTIRCGPGAVAARVARRARTAGLHLPPLPSSAERCTVGGMVANNAAGARSFRHGATRDWVVELEVVLAGGARVRLEAGRPPPEPFATLARTLGRRLAPPLPGWPGVRKNASGYALDRFLPGGDALHLVVGSEGTLGVVVAVTLRLVPRPPERGVLLVGLPGRETMVEGARAAAAAGAAACELFGRRILELARLEDDPIVGTLARAADGLLLLEMEGDQARVADGLASLRGWAGEAGLPFLEARDEEGRARLWEVRHAASPLIARAAERGLLSTQFIEDSVVPVSRLPAYLEGLEAILAEAGMEAVVFGHAGDGNLHVNPLVDVCTPGWRDRVRTVLDRTAGLVGALGGTLTGEHGDGRLRAPFLDRIWPAELVAAFHDIKRTLDPAGVLNPGVIVPLPGQDPLAGLWAGREGVA